MKDIQLITNLIMSMIILTTVSIITNIDEADELALERLRIKKQRVISCGYNQPSKTNAVYYRVNSNDHFHESCINPLSKPGTGHAKEGEEGSGCSHSASVGALLGGSANRKQYHPCTA